MQDITREKARELLALKEKLNNDFNEAMRKQLNLDQKIDLGYWRLFFLRDLKLLWETEQVRQKGKAVQICFVVNGDAQRIEVAFD